MRSIAVALIIALIAGCSSGNEQKPNDATPEVSAAASVTAKTDNACQLLTKSEAATVLGASIKKVSDEGAPQPVGTMLRSSCFYRADEGSTVQLTVNSFQTPAEAAESFGGLKRMYRGARAVANVGSDAFAEQTTLVANVGSRYLTVELIPAGSKSITDFSDVKQMDPLIEKERQIILTAIDRLPPTVSSGSVASSPGSACSMITKDEMAQLLGGPLTHSVPTDSPGKTVCTYTGANGRYAQITIEPEGGETGMAGARMAGSMMKDAANGMEVMTKVDDLGDEALFGIGGVLNVRKGNALLTIDLRGQDGGKVKATEIAKKLIAKL